MILAFKIKIKIKRCRPANLWLCLYTHVQVRTQEEIGHNEILDFEMISFEGNLPNWRAGQPGGPKLVGAVCSAVCG